MKKSRKLITIMVFVFLFSSFLASGVYAKTVAKIGSKGYSSLQKAVDAAVEGNTIKVVADIRTAKTVDLAFKKVTIDFQNYKYTYVYKGKEYGEAFCNLGGMTFKNANIRSNSYIMIFTDLDRGVIESGKYSGVWEVNGKGSLTIKGGSFTHKEPGWLICNNNGKVTIKGGKFSGHGDGEVFIVNNGGTMAISGGTFQSDATVLLHSDTDQKHMSDLKISGGNFKNTKEKFDTIGIDAGGKVNISKGTFYAYGRAVNIYGKKTKSAVVSGGTFKYGEDSSMVVSDGAKLTIKGGTFGCVDNYGGTLIIKGGKSKEHTYVSEGGKTTIYNYTINQGKNPEQAMLLADDGSTMIVKGGSYKSPKGFLYATRGSGKVKLAKSKITYKVKALVNEEW